MAFRAAQEEFKRRLGMLHQRYLDLARNVVSQMEQFDGSMREVLKSDWTVKDGANINGLKQFDKNGLPAIPEPSVANGLKNRTNGSGALPIEP
jgi:hypothetical protein